MDESASIDSSRILLRESDWRDLRQLVRDSAGIKLSEAKRVFLVSRLAKRLRVTGCTSFREYYRFVTQSGPQSGEYQQLINAVTTNKTDFFREPEHFDVLSHWLASDSAGVQKARSRGLRVWCAAASTGEEPYTIAAVVRARLSGSQWSIARIHASDIDTTVLETARRAIYDKAAIDEVSPTWRSRMFVAGTGNFRGQYRVVRDLRNHVELLRNNLVASQWSLDGRFDAIFCRNVLIYFDRATQEQVVRRLLERLEPHGMLFLGHAESLNGLHVAARTIAHSVYAADTDGSPSRASASRPKELLSTRRVLTQASPAESRRPLELELGRVLRCVGHDLESVLHESLLFLLYDERRTAVVAGHVPLESFDALRDALKQGLERWSRATAPGTSDQRAYVKVVAATAARDEQLDRSIEASTSRVDRRLEVVAVRSYQNVVRAWIEPRSARILLQPAAPRQSFGKVPSSSTNEATQVEGGGA